MSSKSVFHGTFRITGCYLQSTGYWTPKAPHMGLDLVGVTSKQIYSPVSGKVEFAGNTGDGFGNYVRIRSASDNRKYYLCHMASIAVKSGQAVDYGTPIGIMGATGNATGPHTHFEIRDDKGNRYSPADYLGLPNKQSTYTDSHVTAPKSSAGTPFPGAQFFGPGKVNQYILQLGKALVAKGYGKHYKVGPSTSWGDADRLNVQDFQRAQGWSGSDADGIPGAETWKRLGLGG